MNKASDEFEEKRSRFIGFITPAKTEEEAISFINEIRSSHTDARHNCYAYVLKENSLCRYSDDGEPHGTAGQPILEVIKGYEIYDCCIVVTRYFGGTLLGTGGLVRAYTQAAKMALEKGTVALMCLSVECNIVCDYSKFSQLEIILKKYKAVNIKSSFAENITVDFSIKKSNLLSLEDEIKEIFAGKLEIQKGKQIFLPFKEKN